MKKQAKKNKTFDEEIDLDNPEFKKAWELLNYTRQSVFLTGKAGTGKSTFLRYITANTSKTCVVLAPTGIAAVNAGGQTIHSFFKIPLRPILPDDEDFSRSKLSERMKYSGTFIKLLKALDLIIIDEISMVRADIIDFIDKLLCHFTGNRREPFGGKQLLLVGDVFQLEPVVTGDTRDIIRQYYPNPYFFSARAFSEVGIVPIELRKVYRQNQAEFISLLDRLRTATTTPADIMALNARCVPAADIDSHDEERMTMTLATRRDMVDHINESRLDSIKKPLFTFTGEITGDFPLNALPTDLELSLKEGAQVVFIKNDRDKRWVNGTLGRVESIAADKIEVRLETGGIYIVERERWGNIRYEYNKKTRKVVEKELGSFTQYPLKLAWALTVHKSQGLTFDNVIIDIGRGAFVGGQTYVALSRCRSLEGLTLRSTIAERDIFVNPAVVQFSKSFNSPALIEGALDNAHADNCFHQAVAAADDGDISAAFDLFVEGLQSRNIVDNKVAMRYARRKLQIVDRLKSRVAELEARIDADTRRFENMALEYVSMGEDCIQDDIPQAALANFDKALALCPSMVKALLGRAQAFEMLDDDDEAVAAYRNVLDVDGGNLNAIMHMGAIFEKTADWYNALDRYLVALDIAPDNYRLHERLAVVYARVGDKKSALRHKTIARRLKSGR